MTIWPGDEFTAESGETFVVSQQVAYQGREGCRDPRCRFDPRHPDTCMGWHCSLCDAPTSMMGHKCPRSPESRDSQETTS